MSERENTHTPDESSKASETARGADDRTKLVRPQDDPAPSSPSADRDAVEKGEEILERIKAY